MAGRLAGVIEGKVAVLARVLDWSHFEVAPELLQPRVKLYSSAATGLRSLRDRTLRTYLRLARTKNQSCAHLGCNSIGCLQLIGETLWKFQVDTGTSIRASDLRRIEWSFQRPGLHKIPHIPASACRPTSRVRGHSRRTADSRSAPWLRIASGPPRINARTAGPGPPSPAACPCRLR